MMRLRLLSCRGGSAAVEMALVLPILLALLFGSVELGRYFHNEHILVKAVRDGARFAARQDFSNYTACTGAPPADVVTATRSLVMTGLLSGGSNRLANWNATTINITMSCQTTASGQTMSGIYRGSAGGAPIVTVSASVPYTPVFGTMVFGSLSLNASQQATVTGI